MHTMFRRWPAAFCLTLALTAGCGQRLRYDEQKSVSLTEPWIVVISGPEAAQQIRVVVSSTQAPVNVAVILEKDVRNEAYEEMPRGTRPAPALAFDAGKRELTLEATIPAKQDFRVWVVAERPTQVTLKINSI